MKDRFRPLDGESFSKLQPLGRGELSLTTHFRPLDGESFSKLLSTVGLEDWVDSFRPLDGESFSKR